MKAFVISRLKSFRYAITGWWYVVRTQRNAWIHAVVSLVVVVYILSNVAYVKALPIEAIAGSTRLAADALEAMGGPWGARFISAAIVVSTFGITNVFILTGARVYQVMAEGRMFIPAAARIHPRFGTPVNAILLQSVWASGLLLSNTYGQLLQYVTFGDWIFFGLTAWALIVLRRKMPAASRPYRTWGYPVTPLVFALIAAAVVVNVFLSSLGKSLIGSAIILAGLPIYFAVRRKGPKGEVS